MDWTLLSDRLVYLRNTTMTLWSSKLGQERPQGAQVLCGISSNDPVNKTYGLTMEDAERCVKMHEARYLEQRRKQLS